jgi:hypothetical protein
MLVPMPVCRVAQGENISWVEGVASLAANSNN